MRRHLSVCAVAALLFAEVGVKAGTLQEVPLNAQDLAEALDITTHKLSFSFDSPVYAKCVVTQNDDGKDVAENFLIEGPLRRVDIVYFWKEIDDLRHILALKASYGLTASGQTWIIHNPPGPGGFVHTFALSLDGKSTIALNEETELFSYAAADNAGKNPKHLSVTILFSATKPK